MGYTGHRHSQGHNYSVTNSTPKKGLYTDLGNNIFNYGHKAASDQMIKSLEKLVQDVGTKYGQDISNDLYSKIKVNLVMPVHLTDILVMHATQEALVRMGQSNTQAAQRAHASMLRASSTADPSDAKIPTKIEVMDNAIAKGDYEPANNTPIEMSESENTEYGNEWRTCRERNANPEKYRGQAY